MERNLLISIKGYEKVQLLEEVKRRKLTIKEAAILLSLSEWQLYRIKTSKEKERLSGIIYKSQGQASNRCFSEKTKGICNDKTIFG